MQRRACFTSTWVGVLFLAPQLLLVFTFFYWPTGAALYWAFTLEQPWGGGNAFVGFDNFRTILADSAYWKAIVSSLILGAGSCVLAMGLGFVLAFCCDRRLRGARFYQTVMIWPYAIPAPAAGAIFHFVLSPEAGIFSWVNNISPGFWNPGVNPTHAMIMVILAYSWKYIAYNFIFFLAGMQAIPRSLMEASALDGSGPLRRMRDIQLPLLAPTIFFLLVINLTESFVDSFAIIDLTTSGGPAKATTVMVYKIFFDGFKGMDYSGAAAQSIILMLLIMMLTFIQFRFIERRVHYR